MKIAVVILNWNGEKLLKEFIPSVVTHSGDAVIYVVDNASTDGSIDFIEKSYPEIKIIKNKQNHGFAGGYNHALKNVDEDIYVLLNSDVEVTPFWLNPIQTAFLEDPNIDIVQPKILDLKQKNYFEYAGAAGGFIDKYGYPYCRGRIFESLEEDTGQYDDTIPVFWASGACLCIRKDVFWDLRGFDEDFFAHQEEIDLCWRAFNKGYKTIYCGQSSIYHKGGATLQKGSAKKVFLNFRNSLLTLTKNLPDKTLFSTLFTRMVLDGIAAFYFLFQGKGTHFIAILKAHISFYSLLYKTYKKREKNLRSDYYTKTSIVWFYYAKNGKIFDK